MGNDTWGRLIASCALAAAGCCFAPPPAPVAPSTVAPVTAIPDLDVPFAVQMACLSGAESRACALASELAGATAFEGCPASGMTTWLGLVYVPGEGAGPERAVPFFLQVRGGSCDASARVLEAESPEEQADIDAVIAALRAGGPPPPGSGAVAYVRTVVPTHGYYPLRPTAGVSTLLASEARFYLRTSGGRALFVELGEPLVDYPASHILTSRVIGELWRLP